VKRECHALENGPTGFVLQSRKKDVTMQRMLFAVAWLIVYGAGVSQAASVDADFNFLGQSFGGQDVSVDFEIGPVRPVSDATLVMQFQGDYDTMNELVTISLDGTQVGQAGTPMSGPFLGTNVMNNGPGNISFTQTIIISLADLIAAFEGDQVATLLFDRTSNVGGGPNSSISGALSFAAVPEPSTLVLTSLGLVCAGCYMLRRRSSFKHSATF
jgi:hypothetical protein